MHSNNTGERCGKAEFSNEVARLLGEFADEVWEVVVEQEQGIERVDEWIRHEGGGLLRAILGKTLTSRSERAGVSGSCESCESEVGFRQRRPFTVHTVLAGRDVDMVLQYGQCSRCRQGIYPVLQEMKVDREGFTPALQELSLLAGVIDTYAAASGQLLRKFADVTVSSEKIQTLVAQDGAKAVDFLRQEPQPMELKAPGPNQQPLYVGIDGGMVFVDKRWQEVKLGCIYRAEDKLKAKRGELTARQFVAVRGSPEALAERLWPRSLLAEANQRKVVVLADGAHWIWNLAEELFPNRVEILDWYHANEHISSLARLVFGEGTDKAKQWRKVQLDRLSEDGVDQVIEGLRFLKRGQRSAKKRQEIDELKGYLENNCHRMLYQSFRQAGYDIGSGAVESAVNHVVQQRMKRPGMRWHARGADAMLALRSVYRSTGAWDAFWAYRSA